MLAKNAEQFFIDKEKTEKLRTATQRVSESLPILLELISVSESTVYYGSKGTKNWVMTSFSLVISAFYFRFSVISIVEIILALLSPSLGGISSVPIVILATVRSFRNLCLAISAASTAVLIDRPLAFKVTSFALDPVKLVMIPNT
jgi:hypothetical protein